MNEKLYVEINLMSKDKKNINSVYYQQMMIVVTYVISLWIMPLFLHEKFYTEFNIEFIFTNKLFLSITLPVHL